MAEVDLLVVELVARFLVSQIRQPHLTSFGRLCSTNKSINNFLSNAELTLEILRKPYLERWGDFGIPLHLYNSDSLWQSAYSSAVKSSLPWLTLNTGILQEDINAALSHWVNNGAESVGAAFLIAHYRRHFLTQPDGKNPFDIFLNRIHKLIFSKNFFHRYPPTPYQFPYQLVALEGMKKTRPMTPQEVISMIFEFPSMAAYCDIPMEEEKWESASIKTLAGLLGENENNGIYRLKALASEAQWFTYTELVEPNYYSNYRYGEHFIACIRADKGHIAFIAAHGTVA